MEAGEVSRGCGDLSEAVAQGQQHFLQAALSPVPPKPHVPSGLATALSVPSERHVAWRVQ